MEARTRDYGSIGWAVGHLRHGWKLRRQDWPDGQWLMFDTPASTSASAPTPAPKVTLVLSTPDNTVPWQATQGDLLATDWVLVDAPQPGEYHADAA